MSTLSTQLVRAYGKGFGAKNLARMIQFAEVFPDEKIVVSLVRQLSWTHFIALMPVSRRSANWMRSRLPLRAFTTWI